MACIVTFDTLEKVGHLGARRDSQLEPFSDETCCDYVDSLHIDGERYGVVVFVEPCGNIVKWGTSFDAVLDWWIEVFRTQPSDMGYCEAGWYLDALATGKGLPDNPNDVWDTGG